MSIIRPRIWAQQPQIPVEIDWSNPLAAGLLFFSLGDGIAWSNLDGWHVIGVGAGGPKGFVDTYGVSQGFGTKGSGTTDRLVTKNVSFPSTGYFSMLSFIYPVGTGGSGLARITNTEGSTGADAVSWSSSYRLTNNPIDGVVVNYPTTGAIHSAAVASAFSLNQWQSHAQVINLDSITTLPRIYKNGAELSGVVWNGGVAATGTAVAGIRQIGIGNRSTDSLRNFDGYIGPTLMVNNNLMPGDVQSLHDNIWQIIRPRVT